jgi:hypothetical protein
MEAMRFRHNYIGTEHLLLGLTLDEKSTAAHVLRAMGVEIKQVRNAVEFILGRGENLVPGEIGLTPRAKKIVELAVVEARRLNDSHIGSEHLLLGMSAEGEGIAFGVLESMGVTLERLRAEVRRLRETPPDAPDPNLPRRSVSNPVLRDQAISDLKAAISAIEGLEQSGLSSYLLQFVVLPKLASLLADVSEESPRVSDILETRARLRDGVSTLISLREAFRKERMFGVTVALSKAAASINSALAGKPQQP